MRQSQSFFSACLLCLLIVSQAGAETTPSFAQRSEANGVIAKQYFRHYMDRNWAQLAPLLAEESRFSDPTAEPIFGTVARVGKQAVLANFKTGYAGIQYMRFNEIRVFLSDQFAIFEGTLDWSLALDNGRYAVTDGMPFMSIIKVENGLVVEHLDYAGYQPFIEAYQKANTAK